MAVTLKVRADLLPSLHRVTLIGLQRAAAAAVTMIRRRTASGSDCYGGPFKPYTRRYRTLKMATGRDSGIVDLTLTGAMLRSMNVLRTELQPRPRVVIGFSQEQHRRTVFKHQDGRKRLKWNAETGRMVYRRKLSRVWAMDGGKYLRADGKRVESTVPMATVVRANNKIRPFFDIVREDERAKLVGIIRSAIRSEWRSNSNR